ASLESEGAAQSQIQDPPGDRATQGSALSTESSGRRTGEATLEEIVVTAQKKEERLQDVPVPVTAISGETLVDGNQLRLEDYFSSIPGLNVTPTPESTLNLTIRGISALPSQNPTVGVSIDDVPFGGSVFFGGGGVVPDIDPGDLNRLEVLRGPQGT